MAVPRHSRCLHVAEADGAHVAEVLDLGQRRQPEHLDPD